VGGYFLHILVKHFQNDTGKYLGFKPKVLKYYFIEKATESK
jgi:hypothetical protein